MQLIRPFNRYEHCLATWFGLIYFLASSFGMLSRPRDIGNVMMFVMITLIIHIL